MAPSKKPGEEDLRLKTQGKKKSEIYIYIYTTGGEISGPLVFSYRSDMHQAPGIVISACTSVLTF